MTPSCLNQKLSKSKSILAQAIKVSIAIPKISQASVGAMSILKITRGPTSGSR